MTLQVLAKFNQVPRLGFFDEPGQSRLLIVSNLDNQQTSGS